jgi:hypothetical protein
MANLLHDALKNKGSITLNVVQLPEPRLVNFNVSETGAVRRGDAIELCCTCVIKEVQEDGTVVANLVKAEPEEMDEPKSPSDTPMMVRQQTEPMPG